MQQLVYKEHAIMASALRQPDRRWGVRIAIVSPDAKLLSNFTGGPRTFDTQQEPEAFGIAFGTKWIDDGKPAPDYPSFFLGISVRHGKEP